MTALSKFPIYKTVKMLKQGDGYDESGVARHTGIWESAYVWCSSRHSCPLSSDKEVESYRNSTER